MRLLPKISGLVTILGFLFAPVMSTAQEQVERHAGQLRSLEALLDSIQSKSDEITVVNQRLSAAGNDATRASILTRATELESERASLKLQFDAVAGGENASLFIDQESKPFDLQTEAASLLEPLFNELQNLSHGPRELEQLKTEISLHKARHARASRAVKSLERLIANKPEVAGQPNVMRQKLSESLSLWQRRRDDAHNQMTVLEVQYEEKLAGQESLGESLQRSVLDFLRTRGMNLLLAIAAFLVVYLLVRLIHRAIERRIAKAEAERSIYARLIDVALHVLAFVAALCAIICVFLLKSDLLLLGLSAIFIAGLAWGGVKLIPALLDELRMVLNLGAVREGERVLYAGLPWRVDVLGFQTDLSNPDLTGGKVTIPVRGLVDMQSRPYAENERWFPCEAGDWVRLETTGTVGQVECQTPEYVSLRLLGGTLQTLPATAFLEACPSNISEGYRIEHTFGIDYRHRAEATGSIQELMQTGLREAMEKIVPPEQIQNIVVQLATTSDSSLDYEIEADFTGEAAPRHEELRRRITGILVDLSNANGWKIPYRQMTIHTAPSTISEVG